jgi:hypothetical protein
MSHIWKQQFKSSQTSTSALKPKAEVSQGARSQTTGAAMQIGKDQRKQTAHGSAVDDNADKQSESSLGRPADKLGFRHLALRFIHLLLERDGAVHRLFPENPGEPERKQSGHYAGQHAAQQKRSNHVRCP